MKLATLALATLATVATVAETVKTASQPWVTNQIAEAVAALPEPDYSTNNTELVDTIETVAPQPGDYATVSNLAVNAVQTETDPVWTAQRAGYATTGDVAQVSRNLSAHTKANDNPHNVTAEQVGALPVTNGEVVDQLVVRGNVVSRNLSGRSVSLTPRGLSSFNQGTSLSFDIPSASGTLALDSDVSSATGALHRVASSGSYNDLGNTPDLSGYATTAALHRVALSGSYNDLANTPDLSGYATTDALADYLPLSGGVVTGSVFIASSTNDILVAVGEQTYGRFSVPAIGTYPDRSIDYEDERTIAALMKEDDMPLLRLEKIEHGRVRNGLNNLHTNLVSIAYEKAEMDMDGLGHVRIDTNGVIQACDIRWPTPPDGTNYISGTIALLEHLPGGGGSIDLSGYATTGALAQVESDLSNHLSATNNPHHVTAAQIGALTPFGGTVHGDIKLVDDSNLIVSAGESSSANCIRVNQAGFELQNAGQRYHVYLPRNDGTIALMSELAPAYDYQAHTVGDVCSDGGKIYRCIQSYTPDSMDGPENDPYHWEPTTLLSVAESDVAAATNALGALAWQSAETDPTVPSWAKASSKPSYTLNEICPDEENWLGVQGNAGRCIKVLAGTVGGNIVGGMRVTASSLNDNNMTTYTYGGVAVRRNGTNQDYLWDDSSTNGIVRRGELAPVATSGSYNDLSNAPDLGGYATTDALDAGTNTVAGLGARIFYGTCATGASTAAKVVTCAGFKTTDLKAGTVLWVKFTNAQTYNGAPTINVNSTGAVNIKRAGTTNAARYEWVAGELICFVHDGSFWTMTDGGLATTSYYGATKLSTTATSTGTTLALTPASLNSFSQGMVAPYPVYSKTGIYDPGDRVRYSYNSYICKASVISQDWSEASWQMIDPIQTQLDDLKPAGPIATNSVVRATSGDACRVSLASGATLSAALDVEGVPVMGLIEPAGAYSVSPSIHLLGYGTWPTNSFQAVFWRVGQTTFANVLSDL